MQNSKPATQPAREHGGDLDTAIAQFGGSDWIDLSTGINPVAYPVPAFQAEVFTRLPEKAARKNLELIAGQYFGSNNADCLALAGAQAGIQLLPKFLKCEHVAILGPTYNEHAASFRASGFVVHEVSDIYECRPEVDTLVVVNPNNPDGRLLSPSDIIAMKMQFKNLIVDESFADVCPEFSICSHQGEPGLFVLRSFGKFFGLAGLRLGFILGNPQQIMQLRELAGPWSVNGPAIEVGSRTYADENWIATTQTRLKTDAERLDALALRAGWGLVGGCNLFRLFDVSDASAAQQSLAKSQVWTRIFPYSKRWIRLGLPGCEDHWLRLEKAMLGG